MTARLLLCVIPTLLLVICGCRGDRRDARRGYEQQAAARQATLR